MAAQTLTGVTTNYDSGSVLGIVDGETITLNGAALTINSDVRLAQNAAALGALVCSSVFKNSLTITSKDTWEIPFGGGSHTHRNTSLLVGFDGSYTDESANPKSLTVVGGSAVSLVPTSSIGFGTHRAFFDGTGGHIDIDHTGSDFSLGTGNFTFFCEFEVSSLVGTKQLFAMCASTVTGIAALRISLVDNKVRVSASADNVTLAFNVTSTLGFVVNQPVILKVARSATNWYIYLNSTLSNTWTSSVSLLANASGLVTRIGSADPAEYFSGFLDEVSLMKSTTFLTGAGTIVDRETKWPRTSTALGQSSGNVPVLAAFGLNTVTGLTSGATGELLRVFTTDSYVGVPTVLAPGSAMPTAGFIKLRTKTGNFIPGETIALPGGATIVASDSGRVSWLHIQGREASAISIAKSTTTKLLGEWHLLGITDGTVNQKFQFPVTDACAGIYVETGPDTGQYEWWMSGGARWGTVIWYIPTDTRGKYFGSNPATGVITIAKRSTTVECGFLPPAGCRVLIGNLILSNVASTNYAINTVSATDTSKFSISTTANGVLEIDKVTCNWRCDFQTPYSISVKNSSILLNLVINNSVKKPLVQNVGIGLFSNFDRAAIALTSNVLGSDIFRIFATRYKGDTSSTWTVTVADNYGTTVIQDVVIHIFGNTTTRLRTMANVYTLAVYRTADIILDGIKTAGANILFSATRASRIYRTQYADLIMGATTTSGPTVGFGFSNSSDAIVSGFSNYDNIPNVNPYAGILQAYSTSSLIYLIDVGTPQNPYNGGAVGFEIGYAVNSTSSKDIKVRRVYLSTHRSAILSINATLDGLEAIDVWGRADIGQTLGCSNAVTRNCRWSRSTTGQSACYGRHFEDFFNTTTAKFLNVVFNEASDKTTHMVKLYGDGQPTTCARLSRFLQNGTGVLSEDQLTFSGNGVVRATTSIAADSLVKWDWEVTVVAMTDTATIGLGRSFTQTIGFTNEGVAYNSTGQKMTNNALSDYGEPYGIGDVIGVAVDMENNTVEFFKNGISQGIALTGLTGVFHPAVGRAIFNATYTVNFGQNPRAYPVKPGFTKDYGHPTAFFTAGGSLAMANLSDEVILEMDSPMLGVTAMDSAVAPTFTGTNASNHYVDFQYDLGAGYNGVWLQATTTNFATVNTINPATGIRLKIRVVPSSAATNNLITFYLFPFVSTEALQRVAYPDPVVLIDGVVNGVIPGSRVKITNKTTNTQVYNQIAIGTSVTISYEEGVDFTTGNLIEIRVTNFSGSTAKLPFKTSAQATAAGWSAFVEQKTDDIYSQIAIDGSTIDEFIMDTVNNYIRINKPDKSTSVQRLYAWSAYHRNTEFGIAHMFDTFEAIDVLNFRRNPIDYTWFLYNELLTSVRLTGAYVYSSDDSFFIADSEAGVSGSIFMDSKRAYGVETTTSGLTSQESALLSEVSNLAKETSVQAAIRAAKAAQAFSLL